MATTALSWILVVLAAVAVMQPTTVAGLERVRRMIGGSRATGRGLPGHVVQLELNGVYTCAAILTKPNKVITSSYCAGDYTTGKAFSANSLRVRVGSTAVQQGGTVLAVKSVQLHPQWKSFMGHTPLGILRYSQWNVAVLTLSSSARLSSTVSLAKIAGPGTSTAAGSTLTTYGWGVQQAYSSTPSQTLQTLSFKVLAFKDCKAMYAKNGVTLPAESICLNESSNKAVCSGDGGAPYESGGVVKGLFSFNSCGLGNFPGVAVDLAKANGFLKQAGAV